jgi:predicted PhzF superfamily epimerase YddE/YHI9
MTCQIYHVDAFTSERFRGNPAGVCLLEGPVTEANWMQAVAAEMNLSETAFVSPRAGGAAGEFDLRWFAPLQEVALCGHATLATAHVLWESGRLPSDVPARFHIRSGDVLTCTGRPGGWIEMDFPAGSVQLDVPPPPGLVESIGAAPVAVARSRFDYLLELESEAAVRSLRPDFTRLLAVATRGVIATARADDPAFHFVSRFFCPSVGVNEDPVTGSAHCTMAVYWSRTLKRTDFVARQLSQRGGLVRVALHGERATLSGQAVTVARGELC